MSQDMTNTECSTASKAVKDSGSSTPFGSIFATSNRPQGTLIYMAPEQMQARKHLIYNSLSLTGVSAFGHTPLKMQNTLKVLKARYHQKLGIPHVVS
jgi:hypothetical protein